MIISISSLKGGVGKSTIAQNLAVCFARNGYKVCIIDSDANQSSLKWSSLRTNEEFSIPAYGLPDGNELGKNASHLDKLYDVVIIDGTPNLSKLTSKIILTSNFVFIPVLPSGMDVWATRKFLDHYQNIIEESETNIPAYFIMNKFRPNTSLSMEVKECLAEFEIPVMETCLKDRVAYGEAVIKGSGVYEHRNKAAKEEITNLFNEVMEIITK